MLASLAVAQQGLASLKDERLDLLPSHAEHGCDLGMRLIAQLEQHERGALVVGQPLDVFDHFPQLLSQLNATGWAVDARMVRYRRVVTVGRFTARAQLRQAPVARNRVQPGT